MNRPHHAAIERISVFAVTTYIRGVKLLDRCLWLDGTFFMLETFSEFGGMITFVHEGRKTRIHQMAAITLCFNASHSTVS
jgi:hypothetical protein